MQQFVNGLSAVQRARLMELLTEKRNEMAAAYSFSMTARLV